MNIIKKFIKWMLFEIKSVYEDLRKWHITEQEYEFMFWFMCAFWAFILVVFFAGLLQ